MILILTSGCTPQPEVSPDAYGKVVDKLPRLEQVEAPFEFPYAGDTDHSKCEFKEEDFF